MRYLLFGLVLLIVSACGSTPKTKEPLPPPVTVATVESREVPYVIRTIGTVMAWNAIALNAQVSGQLLTYHKGNGEFVKKGDLLATIDPAPYEAAVKEARGLLTQARAQLEYNQQRVERYSGLVPDDFVSPLDYQQYIEGASVAKGQIEQYEGALQKAEIELEYCYIRAPFDGYLGIDNIDPGNIVYPEERIPLNTLNVVTPINVDFTVPQRDFYAIKKHFTPLGLDVIVSLVGDDSHKWTGKLADYDNQVSVTNGTIKLESDHPNEDASMWPGMWVNVEIILYQIPDALVIPSSAVQLDTKGHYVYVLNAQDEAEKRPVTRGQLHGEEVVITHGLKKGEVVVTQGQRAVAVGGKVRIKS